MTNGGPSRAAVAVLLSTFVLALFFGSDAFVEDIAFRRGTAELRWLLEPLARPSWATPAFGGNEIAQYLFLLLWPITSGLLVLVAGRSNRFLGGWYASIGGAAVAGGLQFLVVVADARGFPPGQAGEFVVDVGVAQAMLFALMVGWVPGLAALVAAPAPAFLAHRPPPPGAYAPGPWSAPGPWGAPPPPWGAPPPWAPAGPPTAPWGSAPVGPPPGAAPPAASSPWAQADPGAGTRTGDGDELHPGPGSTPTTSTPATTSDPSSPAWAPAPWAPSPWAPPTPPTSDVDRSRDGGGARPAGGPPPPP